MQTLGYFLIWGAFIFLMMRFGCGAHVMGHGQGHHHDNGNPETLPPVGVARATPPTKEIDPVCGMKIDIAGSKSTVQDGHVYYFCSQDCRGKFEASPKSYKSGTARSSLDMEHTHELQR